MKQVIIFISCFLIGLILALGYFTLRKNNPVPAVATKSQRPMPTTGYSLENAPKNSIRGEIATFSGQIDWQSRTATQSSPLVASVSAVVQQGEDYTTKENGEITFNFPDYGSILLSNKTKISITQTLPVNFVFNQASGSATYVNFGKSPFSVRTLHLLTNVASGSATINVDWEKHLISLVFKNTTATVGYNDRQFNSHVQTLLPNFPYIFNDDLRTWSLY